MSLLYRAMWESPVEDSGSAIALCRREFDTWREDTPTGKHRTYELRDAIPGLPNALEVEVVDTQDSGTWRVLGRFRVLEGKLFALVENHYEGDDVTTKFPVGRPRVVSQLLNSLPKAYLGGSALLAEVISPGAPFIHEMVKILQRSDRQLPWIIFTEPPGNDEGAANWRRLAERVAARTTGVAVVVALDSRVVPLFRDALGHMAVWGGGIRTYAPGEIYELSHLHRFMPWKHVKARPPGATENLLVYAVTEQSTRRRVMEPLAGREWNADTGFVALTKEVEDLRNRLQAQQGDFLALSVDYDEQSREFSVAKGHLLRLKDVLCKRNATEEYWAAAHSIGGDDAPDDVQTVSDAVLNAQLHLSEWLCIPDSCLRDPERLDSHINGGGWGRNTWIGLRALAAFSRHRQEGFSGSFWQWCDKDFPDSWPATSQKLSMRESETVANSEKYRSCRIFPVHTDVDASGKLYMEAHLKIALGGGSLSPRVYFHDDTAGITRKVHIGFVGPHNLVPNTKS